MFVIEHQDEQKKKTHRMCCISLPWQDLHEQLIIWSTDSTHLRQRWWHEEFRMSLHQCVCVFLSKNYPPCKRNQSEGSGLRNARAMLVSHLPRRITVSRLGDTWGWMHTCFFWVHACSNIVYAGQNAICQVSLDFGVHNQWCHCEMWYWTSEGPAVCHMRAEPWTN